MRSVFILLSLGAFAACSTGATDGAVLGVSVAPITTQAATQASAQTAATTAAAGLDVSRIRILVNDAKLHGAAKCDEVESGPFVVDLSASEIANGATRNFSLGVSPGTYSDAEIEIEPLHADKDNDAGSSAGAEFADFKTTGGSILIDGTYQGKTFQYVAHFKAEQGQEGKTTTTSAAVVIPMKVDPSTWFIDAQGNVLDPTDSAQHNAIAALICKQLDTETDQASASANAPSGHAGPGRAHCVE